MKAQELRGWILSLAQDIEFEYKGYHGVICPWNAHSFTMAYAGKDKDYTDIEDLMSDKVFNGMSLNQIAEKLEFV